MGVFVCGSVTTITRNCMHRSSPNWVVAISSWLNCGHPAPPGMGFVAGQTFLAPPYYSQRAVFASLWALFSLKLVVKVVIAIVCFKQLQGPSGWHDMQLQSTLVHFWPWILAFTSWPQNGVASCFWCGHRSWAFCVFHSWVSSLLRQTDVWHKFTIGNSGLTVLSVTWPRVQIKTVNGTFPVVTPTSSIVRTTE